MPLWAASPVLCEYVSIPPSTFHPGCCQLGMLLPGLSVLLRTAEGLDSGLPKVPMKIQEKWPL